MLKKLELTLLVIIGLLGSVLVRGHDQTYSIMPWMCLERCGGANEATIISRIEAMKNYSSTLTGLSYEHWDLGPNGTVIDNNFTDVGPMIHRILGNHLQLFGMVTTVNMEWIREVIHDRAGAGTQFLTTLFTDAVVKKNMTGVNFDWEPSTPGITAADAKAYAEFFKVARQVAFKVSMDNQGTYAAALSSSSESSSSRILQVSADIANWTPLWNWTELSAAMSMPMETIGMTADTEQTEPLRIPQGRLIPMSTYTYDDKLWIPRLQEAMHNISSDVLTIGLMSWNQNTSLLNKEDLAWRMGALAEANICHIAIWVVPLPDFWWSQLDDFKKRCTGTWKF